MRKYCTCTEASNTVRVAIDYRRLNAVTRQGSYPLPRIYSCLDALNGSSWFTTIDLRAGFWQVRQDPKDADKTAFITRKGCFRFKVLSFGLTGAPSLFQRLMGLVLAGLTWSIALVYLDDIGIFPEALKNKPRGLVWCCRDCAMRISKSNHRSANFTGGK